MPKCEEKQNFINKIWSNCIQIIDVPIVNNIQGHSSALNPFILDKSREKHSELIIAAHSMPYYRQLFTPQYANSVVAHSHRFMMWLLLVR